MRTSAHWDDIGLWVGQMEWPTAIVLVTVLVAIILILAISIMAKLWAPYGGFINRKESGMAPTEGGDTRDECIFSPPRRR